MVDFLDNYYEVTCLVQKIVSRKKFSHNFFFTNLLSEIEARGKSWQQKNALGLN
jgi:hypothetical protein